MCTKKAPQPQASTATSLAMLTSNLRDSKDAVRKREGEEREREAVKADR